MSRYFADASGTEKDDARGENPWDTPEHRAYGARWPEIDGDVWTIPANRMKAGREHRVPLVERCTAILAEVRQLGDDRCFPISNMAMMMLLRRMGRDSITVHGFRSSFRDWAGEATDYPREVIELSLAHVVGSRTERAYRRQDALDKRRLLMADWAAFCG